MSTIIATTPPYRLTSPELQQNSRSTVLLFGTSLSSSRPAYSLHSSCTRVYGTKRPDHGKYYVTRESVNADIDQRGSALHARAPPIRIELISAYSLYFYLLVPLWTSSCAVDTDTTYLTGEVGLGKDQFQTLLYSATNLTYGLHQITLVNQGFANGTTGVFDVDWIDWETQVPAKASPKIITNNDKSFQFLPKGNWWTYGNDSSGYSGVLYYTQSPTAEFQMDFTGQSVALYGYLNTNHGNYSCGVDGVGSSKLYSGKTPTKEYQQLICYADGLDHGQHTLTVHNVPVGLNTWFSIDYAEVWGDNLYVFIFLSCFTSSG